MNLPKIDLSKRNIIAIAGALAVIIILKISLGGYAGRTVKPKIWPVVDAVYALGMVKTDKWYNIRFGMNTIITKLYVRDGQDVQAGAPLLMTDASYIFKAPFSGTVTSITYREQEMAPAGQPVLNLSNMNDMYVRVSLDQESIIRIRKGQQAELSFENLRKVKVKGRVDSVYQSGDEFLVRIAVNKFPEGVLPEMTCDAAIVIKKNEKALLVPASSVANDKITIRRKGREMTFAVDSKPVDDDWTEIRDGSVLQDDVVIITGVKAGKVRP